MEARIRHPRNDTEDQTRFLHISWLYAQDYCEYQLYLEHVKGVTVEATQAMVEGSDEHQRLEDEFLAKAELEYTFEEAVEESRRTPISSRELYVEDRSLNIRGYIDELLMSPYGFTVIDDKPIGRTGQDIPFIEASGVRVLYRPEGHARARRTTSDNRGSEGAWQ